MRLTREVTQAIWAHLRDLFARNLRQQESQAKEWRRRMASSSVFLRSANSSDQQSESR